MRYLAGVAISLVLGAGCARRPAGAVAPARSVAPVGADSASAHRAALAFLAAFDSLQWEPFRAALAPEFTLFPPGGAARLDGPAAAASFERFFADVRAARAARGQTKPPYLGIGARVRDLRVQWLGPAAVVTFHLEGAAGPASRRTLVFRYDAARGAWLLVHLHGSAGPTPPAAAPPGP